MNPAVKKHSPAAFGISPPMAKALGDTWRVRILAELSVRPMSPSRFVEEVGGELTQISRSFRQLAKWGFIEVLEERPGRRRGAAIEHVYRGIQRAHLETPVWQSVSPDGRDAFSEAMVSSYIARVTEAVEAGTFDQEVDRHYSWDGVALDPIAWGRVGRRLDEVLDWLSELAVEANNRLRDGDEVIPTVVGLAAFRSPQSPITMLETSRCHRSPVGEEQSQPYHGIPPAMSKALANTWRCRILFELSSSPLSPSQFVEKFGGSMTHVSRCFRELAELGLIEIFKERRGGRRGGGVERIYRCVRRAYFDTPSWELLPRLVREEMSQWFVNSYMERLAEAMEAGTFDADTDRHFSWKMILVDRTAWLELAHCLDEILAWLPELEHESLARIPKTEMLIPTIVGLSAFRAPSHTT